MIDAIQSMISDGLTWPEAFFLVGLMGFLAFVGVAFMALLLMIFGE